MPPTCVILNPGSRQGDRGDELERLLDTLEGAEIRTTSKPGDGEALAREAVQEGFETVVAAGGDGTINEVLNGLADGLGKVRLGVLPLGTGNDLARSLAVPPDLEEAFEILRAGETRRLDLARVSHADGERLFLNVATFGLSGRVSERMTPELKRSWGPLSYLRAAVETVSELEAFEVRLTFDDEPEQPLSVNNLVIANGRFIASGVPVAPIADLDDGQLDIMVVQCENVAEIVTLAAQVAAGAHLQEAADPRMVYRRACRLHLATEKELPAHLDGEPLDIGREATFEILPRALDVICGPPPAGD